MISIGIAIEIKRNGSEGIDFNPDSDFDLDDPESHQLRDWKLDPISLAVLFSKCAGETPAPAVLIIGTHLFNLLADVGGVFP